MTVVSNCKVRFIFLVALHVWYSECHTGISWSYSLTIFGVLSFHLGLNVWAMFYHTDTFNK